MAQKLTAKQQELYQRVDEVLYYIWDPMGIAAIAEARQDYQTYVPQVFWDLINGCSVHQIAAYLIKVEKTEMNFNAVANRPRPSNEKASKVAEILMRYRRVILWEPGGGT